MKKKRKKTLRSETPEEKRWRAGADERLRRLRELYERGMGELEAKQKAAEQGS